MSSQPCVNTNRALFAHNRASLTRLPPELLNKVCNGIGRHNLSSLAITCKALNAAVTPLLYVAVVFRAPTEWSRLPSIESLVSSASENFQYIRHLSVLPQHSPLKENQKSEYLAFKDGSEDEDHPLFKLPPRWASDALNSLVRLLIRRLPKHCLQTLRYSFLATFIN